MAYDFKKDSKEFYRSKNKPKIVNVPKANYIAVRGGVVILMKKAEHISRQSALCMQ